VLTPAARDADTDSDPTGSTRHVRRGSHVKCSCYCPHVITCDELGLPCEKFPGTEYWEVTAQRPIRLVIVPWKPEGEQ